MFPPSLIAVSFSPIIISPFFFFLILPPPPTSTLFPYTTLFRSYPRATRKALIVASVPEFTIRSISTEGTRRSEEHTSELQSRGHLVCRLLLEKKKENTLQIRLYAHELKKVDAKYQPHSSPQI